MKNKPNHKPTVVIGMSGGVDSSFIAYLLKQTEAYHLVGVFMQNWDSFINNEFNYDNHGNDKGCDASVDFKEAQKVADMLGIELHKIDFIDEYYDQVFNYFLDELKHNRTPNPDILCNRQIKFDAFLKYAIEHFDADYIAMGHYAGVLHNPDQSYLIMHPDQNKDQTYFLCGLSQYQLSKSLFPIYGYDKPTVRKIIDRLDFPNKNKKDSTGICFIGERKMQTFLANYLPNQPGLIKQVVTNKVVGEHIGLMYYTLGQRKGLNCGGLSERHFVAEKDLANNVLWVAGDSLEDQYLASNQAYIKDINWITPINFDQPLYVRFRHRQALQLVTSIQLDGDQCLIEYDHQKNVTPGQYAVFYQPPFCLGGGPIEATNANGHKINIESLQNKKVKQW